MRLDSSSFFKDVSMKADSPVGPTQNQFGAILERSPPARASKIYRKPICCVSGLLQVGGKRKKEIVDLPICLDS